MTIDRYSKRFIVIFWTVLVLAGDAAIAFTCFSPAQTILNAAPKCLIKQHFGFECPGCGMTRAFIALSSFNVSGAFHLNKMSVVIYPFILLSTVLLLLMAVRSVKAIRITGRSIQ